MRPYTAYFVLVLFWFPVAAQTQPKVVKSVENIEDIEIGMSADLAIAGLTKQGYTLKDLLNGYGVPPDANRPTEWLVSLKNKNVGNFSVEKGRVTSAEELVYDNLSPPPEGDGAIGLAEALYWIFYDNGRTLPSTDRDKKETATDSQFITREIDMRAPGTSYRMIFAHITNGIHYRITLLRSSGQPPRVSIDKLAPFVKDK